MKKLYSAILVSLLLTGCSTSQKSVDTPPPTTSEPWQPDGLVFSTTMGTASDWRFVPTPADRAHVMGEQATAFEIGIYTGLAVRVQESAPLGVSIATLDIKSVQLPEPLEVRVTALIAKGLEGGNEPPLAQIVEALGLNIDVGGDQLELSKEPHPIGDGVSMPTLRAAGPGAVYITAVARYSPDFKLPFGFYTTVGDEAAYTPVNQIAAAWGLGDTSRNHQSLMPRVSYPDEQSFDPPAGAFGLYCESPTHVTHTDPEINVGEGHQTQYAVRTYPIPDLDHAYLVCFEEAANGDYQDYVFIITNVEPAN